MISMDQQINSFNQEMFQLYREVECAVHELNIEGFENPEIVVVGMQSDGKSSFVEAMLGFQFNIVHSTIGTRRPLIIQMINDQSMKVPLCFFRKEQSGGLEDDEDEQEASPSSFGGDSDPKPAAAAAFRRGIRNGEEQYWERERIPVRNLASEISRRTSTVAGADKGQVSNRPIILRVRFAHCANLTIIDTPGFRLGGDPRLSADIDRMVMQLIKPKHRLIVCLEQASVEWANSTSRPLIQRVDPELSRTIIVISKLDNRLKELNEEKEANEYFSSLGEYLPGRDEASKPPVFFISLPIRRDYDETEYKEALRKTYLADFKKILQIGLASNSNVIQSLGIFRLKRHLEKTLCERYRRKLRPTLQMLGELAQKTRAQAIQLQQELNEKEPPLMALKDRAVNYVEMFSGMLVRLLNGSVQGDPDRYGQTLQEEKESHELMREEATSALFRPATVTPDITDVDLKIYGGAQYRRAVEEFLWLSKNIGVSFRDHVTPSQVAASLGFSSPTAFALEKAAVDIVQCKAGVFLRPLTESVISRASLIIKRLFPIAMQCLQESAGMVVYAEFFKELTAVFEQLVDSVVQLTREKIEDDFQALVASVDAATIFSANPALMITQNETSAMNPHQRVCETAHNLFDGVKHMFSHNVRAKMNHFFLMPIIGRLNSGELIHHFRSRPDESMRELFALDTGDLREQMDMLVNQSQRLAEQYKRFQHLLQKQ